MFNPQPKAQANGCSIPLRACASASLGYGLNETAGNVYDPKLPRRFQHRSKNVYRRKGVAIPQAESRLVAAGPPRYSPARRLLCHVRVCGVICWGADTSTARELKTLPGRRVHLLRQLTHRRAVAPTFALRALTTTPHGITVEESFFYVGQASSLPEFRVDS